MKALLLRRILLMATCLLPACGGDPVVDDPRGGLAPGPGEPGAATPVSASEEDAPPAMNDGRDDDPFLEDTSAPEIETEEPGGGSLADERPPALTPPTGQPGGSGPVGGPGGRPSGATTTMTPSGSGAPKVIVPRTGITTKELGVVVNDADPLSVSVAAYYVAARKIPAANVVHVRIADTQAAVLSPTAFAPLKALVEARLASTGVQALLLTWTKPYRVANMSITSAFAMGYAKIASDDLCRDPASHRLNPYLSARESTAPFTEQGFRPTMILPATSLPQAKTFIDRGIASDNTYPKGTAYLMNTGSIPRNARCVLRPQYGYTNECQQLVDLLDDSSGVDAQLLQATSISGKTDVLFYVQGLANVPNLTTNTYLPGAIGDHLTSYGGRIPTSSQMSAFAFLKAGTTASYGTVTEPCAYQQKFPDPATLVPAYLGGARLVEAYWKSVRWPAQGLFLGEPLARPFGNGFRASFSRGTLTLTTTAMTPGRSYLIEAADAATGPFTKVRGPLTIAKVGRATFTLPNAARAYYRFR